MAVKGNTSTNGRIDVQTAFLGLLTWISVYGATTVSVYTSRKGRIWFACRTWGDFPYSTSVELTPDADAPSLIGAGVLGLVAHLPKQLGKHSPEDTWYSAPIDADLIALATEHLLQIAEALGTGTTLADLDLPVLAASKVTASNR
jgi:hypothetical protein